MPETENEKTAARRHSPEKVRQGRILLDTPAKRRVGLAIFLGLLAIAAFALLVTAVGVRP